MNDPATGVRAIPNTVCWTKVAEGELVEYKFNSCGHRSPLECRQKTPGKFRIVITGSSFVEGYTVPMKQSFVESLPTEIARLTGRQVETYNEGLQWGTPRNVHLRVKQLFDAQPDLIVWPLSPWDVKYVDETLSTTPVRESLSLKELAAAVRSRPTRQVLRTIRDQEMDSLNQFSTTLLLRHFLYQSQVLCMRGSLNGDGEEFLRVPSPESWLNNLREVERFAADVESQAAAAGVPFVSVMLPQRSQAAMISTGSWPRGIDPYHLDHQLQAIVEGHGGKYVHILEGFRNIPNPERYYYPIDGHIDARGHRILAKLLAAALTSGAVPELRAPHRSN